jgi:hypothetical protein
VAVGERKQQNGGFTEQEAHPGYVMWLSIALTKSVLWGQLLWAVYLHQDRKGGLTYLLLAC